MHFLKTLFVVLALLSLLACHNAPMAKKSFLDQLQTGDLLFTVSPEISPITDVTRGVNNLKIPHVAIYYIDRGKGYALEATQQKGVSLTPIADYAAKHRNTEGELQVIAGRIRGKWQRKKSVKRALQQLGKPYDHYFMPDDKSIYCSELVQKSYLDRNGNLFFSPIPMEFRNAQGRIPDFWQDLYRMAGLRVPEGEEGSNPGNLSRDPRLQLFYAFPQEKKQGK